MNLIFLLSVQYNFYYFLYLYFFLQLLVLIVSVNILTCASYSAPPIQSARIKSKLSISFNTSVDNHKHDYSIENNIFKIDNTSKYLNTEFEGISFGTLKRLQISGYYWPYFVNIHEVWKINAKL